MEREAYNILSQMERSWWYRGRAALVSQLLDSHLRRSGDMLDYGAGYGGMCSTLSKHAERTFGMEPDQEARTAAEKRGYTCVHQTEQEAFRQKYAAIVLCDVLEHIKDDLKTLRAAHEALENGGSIVLTVPAYQWLWSVHDDRNHHFRRYTRKEIVRLLERADFEVERASYWNTVLFLPALLMRFFGKTGESAFALPDAINKLLYNLVILESLIMRALALPFGLSIIVIARKKIV